MTDVPTLKTVTRTQGNNRALKDGTVEPRGFTFDFEEVPVLVHAFRRMVREHAYDVSEMALTTYLCAREHGARFTALPIFLVRDLHHGAILHSARSPIADLKQLEGRRVGVNRGYTVTTGVWARSVLQEEYDVDLDRVTWVLSGDEHVADYEAPSNVVPAPEGRDLVQLLREGDLDATIGIKSDDPDIVPIIPDPEQAALTALRERDLYPINHLIVVRDELLEHDATLASRIFEAFTAAKDRYVAQLRAGEIPQLTRTDRLHQQVMDITGGDPLPYGIGPNRAVLERLIGHAVSQHILARPVEVDAVFAAGTHDLIG
jgi:hypothetical protein